MLMIPTIKANADTMYTIIFTLDVELIGATKSKPDKPNTKDNTPMLILRFLSDILINSF